MLGHNWFIQSKEWWEPLGFADPVLKMQETVTGILPVLAQICASTGFLPVTVSCIFWKSFGIKYEMPNMSDFSPVEMLKLHFDLKNRDWEPDNQQHSNICLLSQKKFLQEWRNFRTGSDPMRTWGHFQIDYIEVCLPPEVILGAPGIASHIQENWFNYKPEVISGAPEITSKRIISKFIAHRKWSLVHQGSLPIFSKIDLITNR